MNVRDLRILVTGAASGLGRQFCLSLCEEGARVAALDVDRVGLDALAREVKEDLGAELRTYVANVAKQDEVVSTVKRVAAELGSINGLINNAGIYRDGLLVRTQPGSNQLLKFPLDQWQMVIDVDLTGTFLMTREVAAHMIETKTRPGIIINISSISRVGNPGQSNYSAAKAGVVADTKLWAQELAPYGIRVGAIAPGFIRTPILKAMAPSTLSQWVAKVPLERLGEPEEIYKGVRFIIDCDYFNGRCLEIDGGLTL